MVSVLVDILRWQWFTSPDDVVFYEIYGCEDESKGKQKHHQCRRSQNYYVSREVELCQLLQDIGKHYIRGQILQHKYELPALPLAHHLRFLVSIESLRAPGEVVNATKSEYLENIDVSWWKIDVGEKGSDHLYCFSEAKGPKDGQCESHNDEENECAQIDERNEKLFGGFDGSCDCLLYDGISVIEKKGKNKQPVNSYECWCTIVDDFEFSLVVVDHSAP